MINDEVMNKLIKSLEESNRKTIEEANKKQSDYIKDNIKKEITVLKEHLESEFSKISTNFENKYKELKTKYEKLEKELRRNNIIIFGLETPVENLGNFVVNKLNQHLGLTLTINDINNIYTIGKQTTKRPIIVKLLSYLKKQEILKNCNKLKGTSISISEELSIEERKENKILRQHLKKARSKNLNASIKNRKLIVNGQAYSAQELADEEEDTDTEEIAETENAKIETASYNPQHSATRIHNSAPSTPTTREEIQQEDIVEQEEIAEQEVFETEKVEDSRKRKTVKVNLPVNKVIRSSTRINSNK